MAPAHQTPLAKRMQLWAAWLSWTGDGSTRPSPASLHVRSARLPLSSFQGHFTGTCHRNTHRTLNLGPKPRFEEAELKAIRDFELQRASRSNRVSRYPGALGLLLRMSRSARGGGRKDPPAVYFGIEGARARGS
jgi:hypothetical protein